MFQSENSANSKCISNTIWNDGEMQSFSLKPKYNETGLYYRDFLTPDTYEIKHF